MATKRRPVTRKRASRRTASIDQPEGMLDEQVQVAAATQSSPTVIYVHGIGNKPVASVLKCQWDTALFNVPMAERTRMAYWVNRNRYPVPLVATCGTRDLTEAAAEGLSAVIPSVGVKAVVANEALLQTEIAGIAGTPRQRRVLESIAAKMEARASAESSKTHTLAVEAKVLPLPAPLRRLVARGLTRAFLRDVNDFLFDKTQRDAMCKSVLDRIDAGGGPFIVIAHSQGTMIAYEVLRQLTRAQADVRLLVTIGSPLGMTEVKDFFRRQTKVESGPLPFPACVRRWVNVAERLDVVSIDTDLTGEYAGAIENHDGLLLNPDSPWHPHSASGYLSTRYVRNAVRETLGNGFAQEVKKFVIARDLVNELEDAQPEERRSVLIQLSDPKTPTAITDTAAAVQLRLNDLVTDHDAAQIEVLKRFVAARLTRSEVEILRTDFKALKIETIWRNAQKRALIHESTNTLQCRPANVSYGATGKKINWAVLDTGINATHPHFAAYANIVQQWDCTKRGRPQPVGPAVDRNGHGTHVAGIIAGSYATRMEAGDKADTIFSGMAPEASIYGYKVLDDEGNGEDAYIIKALDHITEINEAAGELVIHGVNLSLGGNFDPSVYGCGHTPLCQELRRLWRQGVVVVLAAGNEGFATLQTDEGDVQANMDLSIGDPANLDEAIAVGSVHKTNPHTYGVSYFSSRGPTADGRRKPDVVAPGERIVSACHQYPQGATLGEQLYVQMSGTSMAAPHVSGVIAAFLSLRREFIGYPERVKEMLTTNAIDLRRDPYIQGYGMPNLIMMLARN